MQLASLVLSTLLFGQMVDDAPLWSAAGESSKPASESAPPATSPPITRPQLPTIAPKRPTESAPLPANRPSRRNRPRSPLPKMTLPVTPVPMLTKTRKPRIRKTLKLKTTKQPMTLHSKEQMPTWLGSPPIGRKQRKPMPFPELPDGILVDIPADEDCEEAIAAHHGEIVANQMAKFVAEALPWDLEWTPIGSS